MAADLGKLASDIAISGPNALAVSFPPHYTYQKSACERPDRKARLEEAVSAVVGRPIRLEFRINEAAVAKPPEKPAASVPTLVQKAQRKREKERHPLVRQAMELFEADVEHVTEGRTSDEAVAVREEE